MLTVDEVAMKLRWVLLCLLTLVLAYLVVGRIDYDASVVSSKLWSGVSR